MALCVLTEQTWFPCTSYLLHSLLPSSPPQQPSWPLLVKVPLPAFKVGGVFWNDVIYSLSFCEFQDDHRLSNTDLEQKYGTNIIQVSHQGTGGLGEQAS